MIKNNKFIFVLTVFVAIAVIIGGGLVWNEFLQTEIVKEESLKAKEGAGEFKKNNAEQTILVPGEIDTSTWKTYRNEKYWFEFRYPTDWRAIELTDYEKSAEFRLSLLPISTPPPQSTKLSINVVDKQQADVILRRSPEIKIIHIAGNEGKQGSPPMTILPSKTLSANKPVPDDTFTIVLPSKTLPANQTLLITGNIEYNQTIDEILETFRFTK